MVLKYCLLLKLFLWIMMTSRPRIVDFKAKWEMDSFEYENTVREFPGIKS